MPDTLVTPWCCKIDCDLPATWTLFFGTGPEDNTQSCADHVFELLDGSPLLEIERVSASPADHGSDIRDVAE